MNYAGNNDNVTNDKTQFGRIQREIRDHVLNKSSLNMEGQEERANNNPASKRHLQMPPQTAPHQAAAHNLIISKMSNLPMAPQPMGSSWTGELGTCCGEDNREFFLETSLSCKLFLGGVSWYTSDNDIVQRFMPYGLRHLELPSRFQQLPNPVAGMGSQALAVASLGFAYLIFNNEMSVRQLLVDCSCRYSKMPLSAILTANCSPSDYCSVVETQRMKNDHRGKVSFYIDLPSSHGSKPVEVIPWALSDNNYFRPGVVPPLDPKRTVFIGNLHGTIRARELASMIEQIFNCSVEYAGIDIDKYRYPIGSGRVTFQRGADYSAAINTAFVDVRTSRFQKRIQIDPYLEDVVCPRCKRSDGPYFCRTCFEYFCVDCWVLAHQYLAERHPKPLARRQKRTLLLG